MNLTLDRSLPISLGVQLRGLIEYGVACGELKRGERLPSVRRLAEELGVAPMTVAQVFKELQTVGLIRSEPGRGSFVAGDVTDDGPLGRIAAKLDALVREAAALGIGRSELAAMVEGRPFRFHGTRKTGLDILFVGNFLHSTEEYVAALRPELRPGDAISGTTIDHLAADPRALAAARDADLLLTVANRAGDLHKLVGDHPPIQGLSFIPAESSRRELAALDPRTRLGLVSTYPEFLPIMKAGVRRFASHIPEIASTTLEDPALDRFLQRFDMVVVAIGAESVVQRMPASVGVIFYRHVPDPLDIDRTLKPLLARLGGEITEPRLREVG